MDELDLNLFFFKLKIFINFAWINPDQQLFTYLLTEARYVNIGSLVVINLILNLMQQNGQPQYFIIITSQYLTFTHM